MYRATLNMLFIVVIRHIVKTSSLKSAISKRTHFPALTLTVTTGAAINSCGCAKSPNAFGHDTHTHVNIWSWSKPFINVVLKPKCVLVLGQLWLSFLIHFKCWLLYSICRLYLSDHAQADWETAFSLRLSGCCPYHSPCTLTPPPPPQLLPTGLQCIMHCTLTQ